MGDKKKNCAKWPLTLQKDYSVYLVNRSGATYSSGGKTTSDFLQLESKP